MNKVANMIKRFRAVSRIKQLKAEGISQDEIISRVRMVGFNLCEANKMYQAA